MSDDVENGGGRVRPGEFRRQWRDDAAEDYELMRKSLRAGLEAKKVMKVKCPHGHEFPIEVADHHAAHKAIELYTGLGFGKPESESKLSPEDEASQQVRAMSDEELTNRRFTWLVERIDSASPEVRSLLRETWAPRLVEALEAG